MQTITSFSVHPLSLIRSDGLQRVDVSCNAPRAFHGTLTIRGEDMEIAHPVDVSSGENLQSIFLPPAAEDTACTAVLSDKTPLAEVRFIWKRPREWTFFVMQSSHTDIGLHNSQYHQRFYSEEFLDEAAKLCDGTDGRPENDRYRYVMEGRWFWENYPADRGAEAAERMLAGYVRPGKIGLCSGVAGNHIFAYGMEEMCRSTYGRSKILRDWGVDSHTLSMIDNNGMPWSMVGPYAEAGYENVIFAPNQWNPLPSTVWEYDKSKVGYVHNPDAQGGGSRIDVRYDSKIPMLFWWQSADGKSRLLVWASTQYCFGGTAFGFGADCRADENTILGMEQRFADRLPKMEARYSYDLWLLESYYDDQLPSSDQTDLFAMWNAKWKYPQIRTLGDPDVPFDIVKKRFGDMIPTLRGEITAGWYQHPLAAPQLLADKLNADRLLARAETIASMAAYKTGLPYPAKDFERAWEYLIWNDEHSYGTSGYQGRRVYETWMQHRDWIEKAAETAQNEADAAIRELVSHIPPDSGTYAVFNTTGHARRERVKYGERNGVVEDIPACGYKVIGELEKAPARVTECSAPPTVENDWYRIEFSDDGSMRRIFDKELKRELLAPGGFGANCFLYTEDNHKSYITPSKARYKTIEADGVVFVIAEMEEPHSGAFIRQTVTLDNTYRRIDICNRLEHIRSMMNDHRYYRYIYYAFPFRVGNARRICRFNGCEAEYAKDLTGHSTDTYMQAHEWCCVENGEYGAALMQRDSLLVEFDHIHPDKTDCGAAGDGSEIYSYVSNDWLQMHETGGSHIGLTLRYAVTSYAGDHKDAGLEEISENWINPVTVVKLGEGAREPYLPREMSLAGIPDGQRLVGIKRAEDGRGMVVRLYGERDGAKVSIDGREGRRITMDERDEGFISGGSGFTAHRVDLGILPERQAAPDIVDEEKPAPVGSVWTGLITKPRAARGEDDGMLYLLWGANMEKNLSHYELYRSRERDFTPSEDNLVARVEPEKYRCGRYVDRGLETHAEYWYRVRAVNTEGVAGEFSEPFSGTTKEPL